MVILVSCEDPNTRSDSKTTEELLSAHGWQLEKFTDTQGTLIADGSLNNGAKLLYGLAFDFRTNYEVRGLDKISRSVVNRGTWSLEDNSKTIAIDIVAFEGDFELVDIKKNSMILKAKTENHLIGVGPEIHLVFKEFNL